MNKMRMFQMGTAAALWLFAACDRAPQGDDAVSVGTAHLTIVDDTHAAASAHVTVKDAATAHVVHDADVGLGASVDVALAPGSYVVDLRAFGDAAESALLCARSTKIQVGAKVTAKIDAEIKADAQGSFTLGLSGDVAASDDGHGDVSVGGSAGGGAMAGGSVTAGGGTTAGGGAMAGGSVSGGATAGGSVSGGATAGGSVSGGTTAGGSVSGGATAGGSVSGGATAGGSVSGGTTAGGSVSGGATAGGSTMAGGSVSGGAGATVSVPVIQGCDVVFGDATVKVSVKASASAGGDLTFVWSGAGFSGSVAGGASADIDVKALLAANTKVTKILVQSKDGVVAQVKVSFDVAAQLLGALKLAGTCSTSITAAAALAVSAAACVDAHASCSAACDASLMASGGSVAAHAACMLDCAVKLATCCDVPR